MSATQAMTRRLRFERPLVGVALAFGTVAAALVLRKALEPATGTGAPFVLFFGAVLLTSLIAGYRFGVLAAALSTPLAAYVFVVRAGYTPSEAIGQAALFAVDCSVVLYLSRATVRARQRSDAIGERLRLANEATAIACWDLDIATGSLGWGPDLVYPGGGPETLERWRALVDPEDRDAFDRAHARSLDPAGDGALHAEVRIVRPEGGVRWFTWSGRTLFSHSGTGRVPVRQIGTAIDVTERREHERTLERMSAELARDVRERKRIEDEQRLFIALLDSSSDFIGIAGPDGTPRYLNPAGRRIVGLPADRPLESIELVEFFAPEERVLATDVIAKAVKEHGSWSGETRLRNWQTGEAIPMSFSRFVIHDASGERLLGIGAIARDISDARRIASEREALLASEQCSRQSLEEAYAKLHESEERFRLTIDEAPIGMALVALDGRFVRVNHALCEIVGYTSSELEQLRFQDITHPDDLDLDVALGGRLARGEIPNFQVEKRYIRKDRGIVTIMLSVSVLRGPDGSALYYIAQIEDIMDRKRRERELRLLADASAVLASSLELEETLPAVAQLVADELADFCIIEIEDRGRRRRVAVASASPQHAQLASQLARVPVDRSRPDLVQPLWETGEPLVIEHVTPERLAAFAQHAEHVRLLRAIDPRSLMEVPLVARGQLLGAIALISTKSSRIYRSDDLPIATTLAQRAALAIDNARLYQNAVQATQLRDQVMGVVAHDLRNPLGVIQMSANSLQPTAGNPERRNPKPRQAILHATKRMTRLIEDLFDVARIEAGQLGIERTAVPTTQLLLDAVDAQQALAESKQLELRLELERALPDVLGDEHRLLQVLENLIGNALKFTPAGGRIIVGAAPGGGEVLFSVRDTGQGMSVDEVAHVFDRFWQARKGTRHGAGLGLPISRGIVESHGGRIWVESAPGRGSCFWFTIPIAPRTVPSLGVGAS